MSPSRGTGGRRRKSPGRVKAGKSLAELDQTDPYAVSKLGHQARRSIIVLIDRAADLPFVGQVRDVVADEDGDLPGAAVHGGLLRGLGLGRLIGRAALPGRAINSYVLGPDSAASSRRSASSTSISPRSTASRTARRTSSSCAVDCAASGPAVVAARSSSLPGQLTMSGAGAVGADG
jgi:hypothetical protein